MNETARPLLMQDASSVRASAARARVKKAPTAFRTISEVADELHIPQHVLRFWETKFQQVKPLKRGGGRRYYRPDDIGLLRRISDLLYIQGYTIKGVQRLLRETGGRLGDDIPPPSAEDRDTDISPALTSEPELPMPGLHPATTAKSGRAPTTIGKAGSAEAEVERLRALLSDALAELEALRALLR